MTTKRSTTARKKQYSAPALEKGLDILELLSSEADGLSISEITERLDKSVGELFRMLVVLEQRGYVASVPGTDLYSLTLKVFELSHRFPPTKRLASAASPILRKLAFELGQSCHVVIYYEGQGRVIVQVDSPSDRALSVRLGANVPLINTCSGHVLLAFADKFEKEMMMSNITENLPSGIGSDFEKRLEMVRLNGYESIESAQIHGVLDIGVPIYDYSGLVVASLVVPFLAYLDGSHAVGLDKSRKILIAAGKELSMALGYEEA